MATTAESLTAPPPARRRSLPASFWFAVCIVALLYFGTHFPIAHYISPQHGVGYALGIIGGSMMLLLLLYPLRKRVRWLGFLGRMQFFFQAHMVMGILGPVLILFHSNFRTGATNSNVALACMLVVSGSGLFGRYFYSKIHHGLYGNRATLEELRSAADRLRSQSTSVQFLPDLVSRLAKEEERIMLVSRTYGLNLFSPLVLAPMTFIARLQLRQYVWHELARASKTSITLSQHRRRLNWLANDYVARRLGAASRVATFHAYERLFSLWHVLHLPLFFMLIIAGIVHVIAVHVY